MIYYRKVGFTESYTIFASMEEQINKGEAEFAHPIESFLQEKEVDEFLKDKDKYVWWCPCGFRTSEERDRWR